MNVLNMLKRIITHAQFSALVYPRGAVAKAVWNQRVLSYITCQDFLWALKKPYHCFQSYIDRCQKEGNTKTEKYFNTHLAPNWRQRIEYNDDATHLLAPLAIRIFLQEHASSHVSIIHHQWVETEQLRVWLGTSVLRLERLNST